MNIDVRKAIGAVVREVREVTHDGKPARMVVAARIYDTDMADLWDALTNAERIPRWFLPIGGELRLGGHYQFEGNAGGKIVACEKPNLLSVTWENGSLVSWLTLHLAPSGTSTELRLEHTAEITPAGAAFWEQYGPGAVGVGWDGALMGLGRHIASGGAAVDPAAAAAWSLTDEGKAFTRASSDAWCAAAVAFGTDAVAARGAADRTTAFYGA